MFFFNTEMEMKKSEIMEFGLKNDVKGDFLSFKNIVWHLLGIFMQPKFILRHKKHILPVFMIVLNVNFITCGLRWYHKLRPCHMLMIPGYHSVFGGY